jgi:hypothetical protein
MDGWRDSHFWRVMLGCMVAGGVFSASKDLFGPASSQPWWGIALTTILAIGGGAWMTWKYRVVERLPSPPHDRDR